MLSKEFRQSDIDWNPAETLAFHGAINDDPQYWDDVESDLADHPEIWEPLDYREIA